MKFNSVRDILLTPRARVSLIFTIGFLLGTFGTSIVLGRLNQQQYARFYALGVMEQTFLATELRAHRQDELQKRIEANLPDAVLAIHQHKHLQSAPESQTALRSVKDFYEMNSLPVPKEIASILDKVSSRH